jgi:hypothetical protein
MMEIHGKEHLMVFGLDEIYGYTPLWTLINHCPPTRKQHKDSVVFPPFLQLILFFFSFLSLCAIQKFESLLFSELNYSKESVPVNYLCFYLMHHDIIITHHPSPRLAGEKKSFFFSLKWPSLSPSLAPVNPVL